LASSGAVALEIGIFIVPSGEDPEATVEQAVAADRAGLDVVAIQDHPYQRRFLDTWTLLSYLAARTERVRLVPDVLNLPLRLPTVIAKAAASLDLLSGGRVELGIGAGSFWDAIEAMGGPPTLARGVGRGARGGDADRARLA
jgi:alkanesulfonate monooxygenase SsuD/methylene tetrahydromethanopterin reductase-like flavin-dependent oxidoreductase (luciferase family)